MGIGGGEGKIWSRIRDRVLFTATSSEKSSIIEELMYSQRKPPGIKFTTFLGRKLPKIEILVYSLRKLSIIEALMYLRRKPPQVESSIILWKNPPKIEILVNLRRKELMYLRRKPPKIKFSIFYVGNLQKLKYWSIHREILRKWNRWSFWERNLQKLSYWFF